MRNLNVASDLEIVEKNIKKQTKKKQGLKTMRKTMKYNEV